MMEQFNNVYVETSGTLPDFIERVVEIDEDRILFGPDAPYYRYATQIAIINASEITQKVKQKVFYENFETLFPKDRITH